MRKLTLLVLIWLLCVSAAAQDGSDMQYKIVFPVIFYGETPEFDRHRLFIMGLDGSDQRSLTDLQRGAEQKPNWSPDGQWVVFDSNPTMYKENALYDPTLADYQIYKVALEHSTPIRLTNIPRKEFGISFGVTAPLWSPDGKYISFASDDIFLMQADGSEQQPLVDGLSKSWSPNGRYLAFSFDEKTNTDTPQREIGIINIETRQITNLSKHPATDAVPIWSADNQWIIFSSDRSGETDLYKIKIDGTELTQLTSNVELEDFYVWSPDARWIAYTEFDRDNLKIITPDGDLIMELNGLTHVQFLQWLPDSSGLLFYRDFIFAPFSEKNYSAIYMLDITCLESGENCNENDLIPIPNTETPYVHTNFAVSPIKLPSH